MNGRHRKIVIAIAAVAALGLLAAPATAHKRKVIHFANTVTIELKDTSGQDKIQGTVTSPKAACTVGRHVQINSVFGGQTTPVASVLTKSNGTYETQVPGGLVAGHAYVASISKKVIFRTTRKKGVCTAAQSTPALFTGP